MSAAAVVTDDASGGGGVCVELPPNPYLPRTFKTVTHRNLAAGVTYILSSVINKAALIAGGDEAGATRLLFFNISEVCFQPISGSRIYQITTTKKQQQNNDDRDFFQRQFSLTPPEFDIMVAFAKVAECYHALPLLEDRRSTDPAKLAAKEEFGHAMLAGIMAVAEYYTELLCPQLHPRHERGHLVWVPPTTGGKPDAERLDLGAAIAQWCSRGVHAAEASFEYRMLDAASKLLYCCGAKCGKEEVQSFGAAQGEGLSDMAEDERDDGNSSSSDYSSSSSSSNRMPAPPTSAGTSALLAAKSLYGGSSSSRSRSRTRRNSRHHQSRSRSRSRRHHSPPFTARGDHHHSSSSSSSSSSISISSSSNTVATSSFAIQPAFLLIDDDELEPYGMTGSSSNKSQQHSSRHHNRRRPLPLEGGRTAAGTIRSSRSSASLLGKRVLDEAPSTTTIPTNRSCPSLVSSAVVGVFQAPSPSSQPPTTTTTKKALAAKGSRPIGGGIKTVAELEKQNLLPREIAFRVTNEELKSLYRGSSKDRRVMDDVLERFKNLHFFDRVHPHHVSTPSPAMDAHPFQLPSEFFPVKAEDADYLTMPDLRRRHTILTTLKWPNKFLPLADLIANYERHSPIMLPEKKKNKTTDDTTTTPTTTASTTTSKKKKKKKSVVDNSPPAEVVMARPPVTNITDTNMKKEWAEQLAYLKMLKQKKLDKKKKKLQRKEDKRLMLLQMQQCAAAVSSFTAAAPPPAAIVISTTNTAVSAAAAPPPNNKAAVYFRAPQPPPHRVVAAPVHTTTSSGRRRRPPKRFSQENDEEEGSSSTPMSM